MLKLKLLFVNAAFALIFLQTALAANSWKTSEDLLNYYSVAPGLFRGGQPSVAGLAILKSRGIKTIISFRHNKAVTEAESAEAKKLEISFYSMPISGVHPPSPVVIKKFLDIVNDPAAQPVFVHCEEGVDRTGAMVAIYRVEDSHWSASEAYHEMHAHGCHTKYPWLADAVFDWAESKGLSSRGKPFSVKLFDSIEFVTGLGLINPIPQNSSKSSKE